MAKAMPEPAPGRHDRLQCVECGRVSREDERSRVCWNRYDRGSHFSPHDAPDLLLDDIRQFFRALR